MGVAGSVGLLSPRNDAVPVLQLRVNDVKRRVVVDSGCSRCLVHVSCCGSWTRNNAAIVTMDGSRHQCMGVSTVCVEAESGPLKFVQALVVNFRPLNFDFILGMDGVLAFGGMSIEGDGKVTLGPGRPASKQEMPVEVSLGAGGVVAGSDHINLMNESGDEQDRQELVIDENDFVFRFDARTKQWTAAWKWTDGRHTEGLSNGVAEYRIQPEAQGEYEKEIGVWMGRG